MMGMSYIHYLNFDREHNEGLTSEKVSIAR